MTEIVRIIANILVVLLASYLLVSFYILLKRRANSVTQLEKSILKDGATIVKVNINDKLYNFLVDTGADKCIIDESIVKNCPHETLPITSQIMVGNGDIVNMPNVKLKFKFDGHNEEFEETFAVTKFPNDKEEINALNSVWGVIGTIHLLKTHSVIDFNTLQIYQMK